MMKHFLHQLRRVKIKEIVDIWKFPIAAIASIVYKRIHNNMWVVCEDENEARDNGVWFFEYVREKHPEQECIYAIKALSPDYEMVKQIGPTVEFGSLKHWIIYLSATKRISSQKAGNPNAALFYFLEVYGLLKNKRVFLQHGVILNDLKWLYYNVTKMDRFICGAYPEYKYVSSVFGYPEGNVQYTGLCRFDGLHDEISAEQKMILIMPTWREWISDGDNRLEKYEGTKDIPNTKYFKSWIDFICSEKIKEIAKEHNVKFIFFPHRDMQKFLHIFPKSNEYIEIAGASQYKVQELIKRASLMITDYSSVFFDMLYMKKPVIFYQFDYELFRKGQYEEGYFHYNNNPFANSYSSKEDVFEEIERYIDNDYSVSNEFLDAHAEFFPLYDKNNCQRVYEVVNNF